MIHIDYRLTCEQCGAQCAQRAARDTLSRRELESLRELALFKRWGRFRAEPTGLIGDYCPRCQRELAKKTRAKSKAQDKTQ